MGTGSSLGPRRSAFHSEHALTHLRLSKITMHNAMPKRNYKDQGQNAMPKRNANYKDQGQNAMLKRNANYEAEGSLKEKC